MEAVTTILERARRTRARRSAGSRRPDARSASARWARACLWLLIAFVAILPRHADAFVLHSHAGHGLHVHVVSGLEHEESGLDRDAFHVHHDAHAHGEDHHDDDHSRDHDEREIFLGLSPEPVRLHASAAPTQPPLERCATFFAASDEVRRDPIDASVSPSRPPIPRGRASRSGTRVLVRTSSALLL